MVSAPGEREGSVPIADQLHQWQIQLADEPLSFARDLATVVLLELERKQRDAAEGHRRFAVMQAALIRAQLATRPPLCRACGDAALVQVAERLRRDGTMGDVWSSLP